MTIQAWEKAAQIAIASRDESMDGYLWYGVVTTGIYCRPSCPSPAARPDNMRIFRTPEAASQAGFRPCKRCQPDELVPFPAWLGQAVGGLCQGQTPGQVADDCSVNPATLSRALQRWLGVSPKALQQFAKTEHFVTLRSQGQGVLEASVMAGFANESSARREVKSWLGLTPRQVRQALTLSWGVVRIELVWLLVAVSPQGVAFAGLGETPQGILADLYDRYPQAQLSSMDAQCQQALEQIARRQALNLPLHVDATAFRMRVWQALQEIPAGQPLHYGELARQIGSPGASRAVGSACAANPICLSIPCHRVLPASGGLGGYRWSPWRKAWLLKTEE